MNEGSGPLLRWATVVAVAFVVQIGVLADLQPFGVHPDVMLLSAICAGLVGGPARGATVGFVAGVLVDLVLPGTLGVAALAYGIVGFAVGSLAESLMSTSRSLSVAITAVSSAAGVLLYAVVAQLLGQGTLTDPHLVRIVGIVVAANVLLCLPALALSRWAEGDHQRAGAR